MLRARLTKTSAFPILGGWREGGGGGMGKMARRYPTLRTDGGANNNNAGFFFRASGLKEAKCIFLGRKVFFVCGAGGEMKRVALLPPACWDVFLWLWRLDSFRCCPLPGAKAIYLFPPPPPSPDLLSAFRPPPSFLSILLLAELAL